MIRAQLSAVVLVLCSVACGNSSDASNAAGSSGTGGNAGQAGSAQGAMASASGGGGSGGMSSGGAGAGAGGKAGSGGTSGSSGSSGGAGMPSNIPTPIDCEPWPSSTGDEEVSATIEVHDVFDGNLERYFGSGALGSDTQSEDLPPMFHLADGAVLKNVIVGKPASDGIHCAGTCYLQNVWWEDVGEDAATLDPDASPDDTMTIECAGARHAADKIFQHNGPGTMVIHNVYADDFGKLYRSCGNCLEQFERHAKIDGISAENGDVIAGVNENYGDTVEFSDIGTDGNIDICWTFEGNDSGAEPSFVDSGADGLHCLYDDSDIHGL